MANDRESGFCPEKPVTDKQCPLNSRIWHSIAVGARGNLGLAARGIIFLDNEIDRGQDLLEMGAGKRHGCNR